MRGVLQFLPLLEELVKAGEVRHPAGSFIFSSFQRKPRLFSDNLLIYLEMDSANRNLTVVPGGDELVGYLLIMTSLDTLHDTLDTTFFIVVGHQGIKGELIINFIRLNAQGFASHVDNPLN